MVLASIPWVEQYRPKSLGEVVGNEEALDKLREWFDSWSPKAKFKTALLHGPAGTGKTSSVIALAKERGYELVEMNASDTRNKDAILRIAGSSSKEGTLTNGIKAKRILLIDEVDGITGREDRGGVKSLLDVITEASVPIICTANEVYDQKLAPLRKIAKVIVYKPIHKEHIVKTLKKISLDQKLKFQLEVLEFIAENAGGDLRSAINDLEGLALQIKSGNTIDFELLKPYRDQTKHLDQALNELFKAKNFQEGMKAIDGLDIEYEELLLWIFENAHYHVSNEKLPEVYETLASADRFLGRISRRQNWILLKYFFNLVSGGVVVDIDKPKHMEQFVFPQKIGIYARTKFTRAITDSISSSIAEKTHLSKYSATNDILYLVEEIMNSNIGNAAQIAFWLELDDIQIKYLLRNESNIKKIRQVIDALEKEKMKSQTSMKALQHSRFDNPGEDWTEVLKEWEKQKLKKEEEEKQQKNPEKELKKPKKKQEPSEKIEEKIEKTERKQASLDQFF